MRRQRDRQRTVVVDFSRGAIKMALAESAGEAVRFRGITRIPLPSGAPGADEAPVELDAARIAECLRPEVQRRGWRGLPAACLLSGSATSTQSFLFPPMPEDDLRRAIELKLGETLHFDLEQAYVDHRPVREQSAGDGTPALMLVAAARIDAVRKGVSALRQAGLRPVAVGAAAESLANLSQCTSLWNSRAASIHIDLGSDTAILNLFEGNQLRLSREIDSGGGAFTRALLRPILTPRGPVQLTREQAEKLQLVAGYPLDDDQGPLPHGIRSADILPLLEPVAQRLSAEIGRSIDYLCGLLGRPGIDRVVLSGSAGTLRNLDRFLQENLNTQVVCSDPVRRAMSHWRLAVADAHPPDLADFAAILGYSLGNRQPINLLPREEKLDQWVERVSRARRAAIPLSAAAGLCLAFAGVPISRTYQSASENFQKTAAQIDARMRDKAATDAERERASANLRGLSAARGPAPDWVGVMKELAALLPEEAQVTSLAADCSGAAATLTLDARIQRGAVPFDALATEFALALSTSPFFEQVHVVEASIADDEPHGRFEATLEIIAGGAPAR